MGGEVGVLFFLRNRTLFIFEVPIVRLARLGGVPSLWHGPMSFTLCSHVVFCTRLVVSCSMGLAMGYGRGYSSSADPMSVDLAVELGGGQT